MTEVGQPNQSRLIEMVKRQSRMSIERRPKFAPTFERRRPLSALPFEHFWPNSEPDYRIHLLAASKDYRADLYILALLDFVAH